MPRVLLGEPMIPTPHLNEILSHTIATLTELTLCSLRGGLRGLVAMRTHLARARASVGTHSVHFDHCNSTLYRAARSQGSPAVPLESPKSLRRASRSLRCYAIARAASSGRSENIPKGHRLLQKVYVWRHLCSFVITNGGLGYTCDNFVFQN